MDPIAIVLTVIISILSLVFVIVGIQIILVLQEIRRTLRKFNSVADVVEKVATHAMIPVSNLGGMVEGARAGMKVVSGFMSWLQREES